MESPSQVVWPSTTWSVRTREAHTLIDWLGASKSHNSPADPCNRSSPGARLSTYFSGTLSVTGRHVDGCLQSGATYSATRACLLRDRSTKASNNPVGVQPGFVQWKLVRSSAWTTHHGTAVLSQRSILRKASTYLEHCLGLRAAHNVASVP